MKKPAPGPILNRLRHSGLLLLILLLAAACSPGPAGNGGNDDGNGDGNGSPSGECFVHLYDGDNFDETDDNFRLEQPGRYGDLSSLPGASKNWDDEADSMRVGARAHVTAWPEPDFGGTAREYPAGDYPEVDPEPRSLELTCS